MPQNNSNFFAQAAAGMSEDEKTQAAQMAMVKLMTTSPEPLLELLERLEIPWEKVKNVHGDESYDTLVIKWTDLREGEKRNQEQGPFIKKVVEQMKIDLGDIK